MKPDALVFMDKAKQELAKITTIDEAKIIRDKAEILRIYAKKIGKGLEVQNQCAEIKIRAERKAGKLIYNEGRRPGETDKSIISHDVILSKPKLKELDISPMQSHRWQLIASIEIDKFENIIARLNKPNYELTTAKVLREAKRLKREKRKTFISNLPDITERYQLYCCDIKDAHKKVKENSVDWIITDPPYPKEYLELINSLGEFSLHALKKAGSLICMIGQSYLPEVYSMLIKYLIYNWTCCYLMPGDAVKIWPRKIVTGWKPLLWFVKEGPPKEVIYDVFRSKAKDKEHHDWGQSESGMADIIERFTFPGETICDPFLGAGTTGVVALKMNRIFIGLDNDIEAINKTKKRMEKIINDKKRTNGKTKPAI